MKQNRRGFLLGLGAVIAAPAAAKTLPATLEVEGVYGIGPIMWALPEYRAEFEAQWRVIAGTINLPPGRLLSIDCE